MKNVVIVGSSGLAKEMAFLLDDINRSKQTWNFLGFVDENIGIAVGKYQVIMNDDTLLNYNEPLSVVIGVGFPVLLKKLANKFKVNKDLLFPNIIHPNCIGDWDRINLGEGNVLTAGNIFTTDIQIGSFNIFNLNGTVGHDSIIGNYNVFNPTNNISGEVKINNQVLVGTGTQVLQQLEIVSNVIIGAGAVVTKNITESGVYVGSPAKKIK
ncbi:MAG: NeuD/PglB/VioB family sugar acetyltransferase [Flavobacteriaceae bacterium]